jgi:hypothetical protein
VSTGSEPVEPEVQAPPHPAVVWQEVEFGSYTGDLGLWSELAASSGEPILELGSGVGRVALALAERGHGVVGIERDLALVVELRRRAAEADVPIRVEHADAADFELGERYPLAIAPMHFVQLLDANRRRLMLARLTAHLQRSGIAALTLVERVPEGVVEIEAMPDMREIDGWLHSSRPRRVSSEAGEIEVERSRERVSPDGRLAQWNMIERLNALHRATLDREAEPHGLVPIEYRTIENEGDLDTTVVLLERL